MRAASLLAFAFALGCSTGTPSPAPAPGQPEGQESAANSPGTAETSPPAEGVGIAPTRARMALHAIDVGGAALGTSPFAITRTGEIVFDITWVNLIPGRHVQRVDIISPRGTPYESHRAHIEIGPEETGARLTAKLLVAGTHISEYALTGRWRAELRLDDGMAPVATVTFDLR